ncbi:DUF3426 domain-containing protein [Ramlibacter sp. G-1-2-2]|uniref:DUF3426 domain-containing protein n=1 Tax=Ramlibacter agri TaxID=2728837 RepID=A0A848HB05_9BURK|nr:DUF3426 domain-containing protein [Ramlibacter agri]NML47965.1 DUF3426 domain-containing protein [Ramlibacter agri]
MSLTTSCPACGTTFRVVPDQLKISEGWVRCGHCSEVFDATANLAEEVVAPDAPGPAAPALPPQPPALDDAIRAWEATGTAGLSQPASLSGPTPGFASSPVPLAPPPAATVPPPAPVTAPEPVASAAGPRSRPMPLATLAGSARPSRDFPLDSQAPEPTELDEPFVFRRSDLLESDAGPSVYPPSGPHMDSRLPSEDDEEAEATALREVSFVRHARRKAFWKRPLVRVFLTLLLLALAALLALQYAWQERDRLALLQPQLRPALGLMCERLHCTLGPPRQIESVVIDSSGFNRLRNDTYKLSFALRNTARTDVAMPSLELTLTDAQDQPLLRRVLAPADLGARDAAIAAGSDWSGAVGIVVNTSGGSRVAGYRLLAFYP